MTFCWVFLQPRHMTLPSTRPSNIGPFLMTTFLPPGRAVKPTPTGMETTLVLPLRPPPSASNLTPAILRRYGSCRVTNDQDYVERAHLCPRNPAAWFKTNCMGQYNENNSLRGNHVTNDVYNAMALRSDVHKAFDDRKFVLCQKSLIG